MINEAFRLLESEVNSYFNENLEPDTEKWVVIGNVSKLADNPEAGGNIGSESSPKVGVLGLVNVEEDKVAKNPQNYVREGGTIFYQNPRIYLNLYALFAITNSKYPDALQNLSLIIRCFQRTNVFDRSTHPGMETIAPGIERLTLDLFTLNFEQVNHLWSTLGGKYFPSVLYKIKVVAIEDTSNRIEGKLIEEIQLNSGRMKR
ncbi:MAG: DUF4255 domain-containing protein [Chitinophagaceae bacterium]|jgi:hypothetical protein|nr:DUF4255 domain-containing protein [Chitinophagaceae bacterium]MCU0403507.1 DUF4255 domain-containing protein [Chitinophagaceae bacterium]